MPDLVRELEAVPVGEEYDESRYNCHYTDRLAGQLHDMLGLLERLQSVIELSLLWYTLAGYEQQ